AAMVFSCTRKVKATWAKLCPSMTAWMARQYLTWRSLPRCWAVFNWRSTALRYEGDMVKRMQHIGTFLHNEMGISMGGMSPMCDRSSIHLQKIFFLRSIDSRQSAESPLQGSGGGRGHSPDSLPGPGVRLAWSSPPGHR